MLKIQLQELIAQAAGCEVGQVQLEHPELETHGDYSCNIALVLKGGIPMAKRLAENIKADFIDRVEVAGPGFINIWLTADYLQAHLAEINLPQIGLNKTVVVDYSSPNIAKPFGIGHLRSTIIGQALYNLYQALGYQTIGDNHLGDWGTQFGKLLYMIDKTQSTELNIEVLENLYVEFHKHPEWEEEGQKWFAKLEKGDAQARQIWQQCVDISLAEFKRVYDILDVHIDHSYGESSYEHLVPEVLADAARISEKSEGATIVNIPGEKVPLMLVKSDGSTTYATRDLASIKFRMNKWHPDQIIYEVGAEQTLHFKQVFAVATMLGYVTSSNSLIHTKHGLYLAPDGKKFSTRQGKTIKLEEVLQEAITKAKGNPDVGVGAIKYFDLSHNVQSDIVFDWDKIMSMEGNSGPYLQYTYARIQSVLAKSNSNFKFLISNFKLNPEELALLRYSYRFAEVVEDSALRYSPNLLCNFLNELAQRYNTFYNKHSILSADNDDQIQFRLFLSKCIGEVLKNGLQILGIKAVERM